MPSRPSRGAPTATSKAAAVSRPARRSARPSSTRSPPGSSLQSDIAQINTTVDGEIGAAATSIEAGHDLLRQQAERPRLRAVVKEKDEAVDPERHPFVDAAHDIVG